MNTLQFKIFNMITLVVTLLLLISNKSLAGGRDGGGGLVITCREPTLQESLMDPFLKDRFPKPGLYLYDYVISGNKLTEWVVSENDAKKHIKMISEKLFEELPLTYGTLSIINKFKVVHQSLFAEFTQQFEKAWTKIPSNSNLNRTESISLPTGKQVDIPIVCDLKTLRQVVTYSAEYREYFYNQDLFDRLRSTHENQLSGLYFHEMLRQLKKYSSSGMQDIAKLNNLFHQKSAPWLLAPKELGLKLVSLGLLSSQDFTVNSYFKEIKQKINQLKMKLQNDEIDQDEFMDLVAGVSKSYIEDLKPKMQTLTNEIYDTVKTFQFLDNQCKAWKDFESKYQVYVQSFLKNVKMAIAIQTAFTDDSVNVLNQYFLRSDLSGQIFASDDIFSYKALDWSEYNFKHEMKDFFHLDSSGSSYNIVSYPYHRRIGDYEKLNCNERINLGMEIEDFFNLERALIALLK